MSKTIVYIRDNDHAGVGPNGDVGFVEFNVYNEAMSYAKWLDVNWIGAANYVTVWNHEGGSGYWRGSAFTPQDNNNYP